MLARTVQRAAPTLFLPLTRTLSKTAITMTKSNTDAMKPAEFLDRFGGLATHYSKYRPTYPAAMYDYLGSLTSTSTNQNKDTLAVDVGCGTGQATFELSRRYSRVLGLDGSPGQIAQANEIVGGPKNVQFAVATATDLADHVPEAAADLVTVAQAVHWFDLPRFYGAAATALRPGGHLAVWTYPIPRLTSTALQAEFDAFYEMLHAGHWWDGIIRKYVDSRYTALPFPVVDELVEVVPAPKPWTVVDAWELEHLIGFISSWSAVGNAKAAGLDPVAEWQPRFEAAWPKDANTKVLMPVTVEWDIIMRVARKKD
ncbi:S-adenosyl-L-methionine-dependent methyltransferase [Blastocladiella britannica]|nr:S-adenosyl-L-methionine-dependent methyltransferase [Blastocladiella britannica]